MAARDFPVRRISAEVLVIGGGIAAMRAALAASEAGSQVRIVSKSRLLTGGAAAVGRSEIMGVGAAFAKAGSLDSPEVHYLDTVQAGGAFLRVDLARALAEEIPGEIYRLLHWGVPFEKDGENLAQSMSDFATYPRNCRVDGRTGYEILAVLARKAREAGIPADEEVMIARILQKSDGTLAAIGLATQSDTVYLYEARAAVAACGGCAQLFSNHAISAEMTGDGYAFALDAGAPLINMEFIQFGPGVLGPRPLILSGPIYKMNLAFKNSYGENILEKHLPRDLCVEEVLAHKAFPFNAENPSRNLDIAIFLENFEGRATQLVVKNEREFLRCAPHTARRIIDAGFSLVKPLPVGIVLQCFNGGIYMEDSHGRTRIPGLFAVGEAAGGLRAPTRPGGNALGETLVFGRRAGREAAVEARQKGSAQTEEGKVQAALQELRRYLLPRRGRSHLQIRREIQILCEKYLSVVRWAEGLKGARGRIWELMEEIDVEAQPEGLLADFLATRNLATVAAAVAAAAERREETRGAHFRRDFEKQREEMNQPFLVFQEGSGSIRLEARKIS